MDWIMKSYISGYSDILDWKNYISGYSDVLDYEKLFFRMDLIEKTITQDIPMDWIKKNSISGYSDGLD